MNKKHKAIGILLVIMLLISVGLNVCGELGLHLVTTEGPMNESIEKLQYEIYKGDKEAYSSLKEFYVDELQSEALLFWAMYMANKYGDTEAYADVYRTIERSYNGHPDGFSLNEMDSCTKGMVIYYLERASEAGDTKATNYLKEVR